MLLVLDGLFLFPNFEELPWGVFLLFCIGGELESGFVGFGERFAQLVVEFGVGWLTGIMVGWVRFIGGLVVLAETGAYLEVDVEDGGEEEPVAVFALDTGRVLEHLLVHLILLHSTVTLP